MKKFSSALLIALIFPGLAFSSSGAWTPASKVKEIIIEGDDSGRALIILVNPVPKEYIPSECSASGRASYNTIPLNTDKGKAMYSAAMAAQMAGKSLRFSLSCAGISPLVNSLRLN